MRYLLYLARPLPTPVMTVIHEHFDLTVPPLDRPPTQAEIRAGIRESQAVICTLNERFDDDMLAAAPSLRVIANYAVGYNNIDVDAAKARSIIVTNTPDVLTNATADITWALILAVARRVVEGDQLVRQNRWAGWSPTQLLGVISLSGHQILTSSWSSLPGKIPSEKKSAPSWSAAFFTVGQPWMDRGLADG